MSIQTLIEQLDLFISAKKYDGRHEDIRGAWQVMKKHIKELEAEANRPWWRRIFK